MYIFDNNSPVSVFAKPVMELTKNLQSESEVISIYFKKNKMIVNTGKFQVTLRFQNKLSKGFD